MGSQQQEGNGRSSVLAFGAARHSALVAVVGKLRHIFSFSGETELLRASTATSVLRRRAQILSDRKGSAETYSLSSPCSLIDVFISHNWVVGRGAKFMVLSYHFNWRLAAWGCLAVHLALVALSARGWLPTMTVGFSEHPRGLACRALWNPLFLLLLCFGADLRACLQLKGPSVFLDKTCIHQTDPEIQRQGILGLGAFLRHSRRMLVIYTDQYLAKLWTVYEFACFLSLHPVGDVQLTPTSQPRSVFLALGIMSLLHPCAMVAEQYTRYALAAAILTFAPVLCLSFRREAREREVMHQRFRSFSVADCSCACEEDRPLVYGKIAQLARATKIAAGEATEEEALLAFSQAAREKLPALVEAGMGRAGHKYSEFLTMAFGLQGSTFLDKAVGAWHGMAWRELLVMAATDAALIFAIYPVALAGMAVAVRRCIGLRGAPEAAFVCAVAWLTVILVGAVWMALGELWRRSGAPQPGARLHWPMVAANLALTLLCACAAAAIYAAPGAFARRCRGKVAGVGWPGGSSQDLEDP